MRRWVNIRFCRFEVVMILRGMILGNRRVEVGRRMDRADARIGVYVS